MVEFRILGGLQCLADGAAVPLGGARQRAVLGLLLVEAPAPVSVARLVEELWAAQPPSSACHAIEVYVSALRKALQPARREAVLRHSACGYTLEVDRERVDARRFERLVSEGQGAISADPQRAQTLLVGGLELWRGAPLEDLSQFEFARREADRLCEVHADAVEYLAQARLECDEAGEAIPALTALIAANPLRERPRRLLMLALYRTGRHAEALATYRDAYGALSEVGLQPGPELRKLEALILRHDPSLKPHAPVTARNGQLKRKVVTALCCDLTDQPAPANGLDPEARLSIVDRRIEEMRTIIERHGGVLVSSIGGAGTAVFGIPRVREDDALRAVRAAAQLAERLATLEQRAGRAPALRLAVNTGLALVDERDEIVLGDAIDAALALERAAEPGQVLLGPQTLALVAHAVQVEPVMPRPLGAGHEAVGCARLIAVDSTAPAHMRRLGAEMVGRTRELALLRAAWDRAVHERECHLFTLVGTAGIGKSRLVAELLDPMSEAATVLSGRCLHYGDGITFWPISEALAALGDRARPVLDRIAAGARARPEELFWEVRQTLEAAALERPVILHIDDLHWAEPMLLDLLDYVADVSRGVPILILGVARPELLEARPGWSGARLGAGTARLEPLEPSDCERLLDQIAAGLTRESRRQVIATSAGNPLFLEELALLARDGGPLTMPPTILALLASRLERLEPLDRELLERGAIEGEVFHLAALHALDSSPPLAELKARLAGLVRAELIRTQPATLGAGMAFRFRHILIRDAAYESLAKATRAQLHEAFADWLDRETFDFAERDEIAGWHLERVVGYRRELGHDVELDLAHRAARHLHAAGRRAGRRGDTRAARKLLERAFTLADGDEHLRARVAADLAEELMEGGDLARVDTLLSIAERDAQTTAHAALIRLHWLTLARPEHGPGRIEATLPAMLARLSAAGDELGLAKAHLAGFWAGSQLALVDDAAQSALHAAAHARNAGDEGLRSRALALYVVTLVYASKDATTITAELDAIETEDPGPYLRTLILCARSETARLRGDVDRFRRMILSAGEQFRAMGIQTMAAAIVNYRAWAELSHGDPSLVLGGLLEADAELARTGERGFRSTVQATLARVYERIGDLAHAQRALALAERLTAPHDRLNLVILAAAHARLALRNHDASSAERWAETGIAHAERTQIPFLSGDAHLELARVLHTTGNAIGARDAAQAALEFFAIRGDQPRAGEAQALLAGLESGLQPSVR